jgi:hypothetical protein
VRWRGRGVLYDGGGFEAKGRVALVVPKLQNLLWSLGYVHVVGTDLVIVRPFSYSMDFGTAY